MNLNDRNSFDYWIWNSFGFIRQKEEEKKYVVRFKLKKSALKREHHFSILIQFGEKSHELILYLMPNSRLNGIETSICKCSSHKTPSWNEKTKRISKRYQFKPKEKQYSFHLSQLNAHHQLKHKSQFNHHLINISIPNECLMLWNYLIIIHWYQVFVFPFHNIKFNSCCFIHSCRHLVLLCDCTDLFKLKHFPFSVSQKKRNVWCG